MARRIKTKRELTRRVVLTYLQSLQILEGNRAEEDFLAVGTDLSPVSRVKAKNPKTRIDLENFLTTKFPPSAAHHGKRGADSGWVINNTYTEVDWSKIVYRIGVRDIGLSSYIFSPVSSIVTIPIRSPKPIWKIILKTKEEIPATYNPNRAWIEYYITIDDGRTWHRINPSDKPTRFNEDGTIVPRVLTINAESPSFDIETKDIKSEVTVTSVRAKYVLYADTNVDRSDRSTPALKSVQVLLYPKGGLSMADEQQVL